MRRDQSGVDYLCPIIDKVIDVINDGPCIDPGDMVLAVEKLEHLRLAITELRDWGHEQYDRAEEGETAVHDLENGITDLRNEIRDLNAYIADQEKELTRLCDKLEAMEQAAYDAAR